MSTLYTVANQQTYRPVDIQIWEENGTSPYTYLTDYNSVRITWAARGPGSMEIETNDTKIADLITRDYFSRLQFYVKVGSQDWWGACTEITREVDKTTGVETCRITCVDSWAMLMQCRIIPSGWETPYEGLATEWMYGSAGSVAKRAVENIAKWCELPLSARTGDTYTSSGPVITVEGWYPKASEVIQQCMDVLPEMIVSHNILTPLVYPKKKGISEQLVFRQANMRKDRELSADDGDFTAFKYTAPRPPVSGVVVKAKGKNETSLVWVDSNLGSRLGAYSKYIDTLDWTVGPESNGKSAKDVASEVGSNWILSNRYRESFEGTLSPGAAGQPYFNSKDGPVWRFWVGDRLKVKVFGQSLSLLVSELTVEVTPSSFDVKPVFVKE